MGVNILYVGGERAGKTTHCKKETIQKIAQHFPVLIMDVKGWDYRDVSDTLVQDPMNYAEAIQAGNQVIRYKPEFGRKLSDKAIEEMDRHIKGADRALKVAPAVWQVTDENHNFADAHGFRSDAQARAMREGNSHGLASLLLSQDPHDYAKNAYAGASTIRAFGVSSAPDRLTTHMGNGIQGLPPGLQKYQQESRDGEIIVQAEKILKNLPQWAHIEINSGPYAPNYYRPPIPL